MCSNVDFDHWIEIEDLVVEDFLKVLTKPETIDLIKTHNIRIRGFSKRINNAPLPLLKKGFENKLKSRRLDIFFKNYVMYAHTKLKGKNYEDGIKEIASNKTLRHTEVIALVGTLYPTEYSILREDFINYLDSPNNLLVSIVDLAPVDILNSIISNQENKIIETYNSMNWPSILTDMEALQMYFKTDYELDTYTATTLLLTEDVKGLGFTAKEKHLLCKLSIFELLEKSSNQLKEANILQENNQVKDDINNDLRRRVKSMQEKFKREKETMKEKFEKEIINKQQIINYLREKKKLASSQTRTEIDKVNREKRDLQIQLAEERQVSDFILGESDLILIFTERSEAYEAFVENGSIIDVDQLESYLTGEYMNKLFFVDVHSMSTAQKREISRKSKKTDHRIKLVNGTPIKIIRNIVYHIEGVGLS